MIGGNFDKRVEDALMLVKGPLPGEGLFQALKEEMAKERIFRVMFGEDMRHVYTEQIPNLNESILPAMLFSWKSETFNSNRVYFDGSVSAMICLPVRLQGDYNSLRRVALIFQRWMGGSKKLFDSVPGLTKFGYGTTFMYDGLAKFDGITCPVIQMDMPFRFDLQKLRLDVGDGFDPDAPLDDADIGWVERYLFEAHSAEDHSVLIDEGILSETGQTNP